MNLQAALVGHWKTDPADLQALTRYGAVTMEFTGDGQLVYTIREGESQQIILMTYEVEGDQQITDQPSYPQKIRAGCHLLPDGRLQLVLEGMVTHYIRVDP